MCGLCYLDSTKRLPGQVEGGVAAECQHENQCLVTGGEGNGHVVMNPNENK